MNTYEITYDGNLRTSALHVDSAEMIHTDAPKDNEGLGESFSPTDLFCTALGSCILTIMAIAARKKGIEIKGTTASVKKTMRSNPRMIDQIDVVIHFGNDFDEKLKLFWNVRHINVQYIGVFPVRLRRILYLDTSISNYWSLPLCCPALIFLFKVL